MANKISFQEESIFTTIIQNKETLKSFLWDYDKYDFSTLSYPQLKILLERITREDLPCRFIQYYLSKETQVRLLNDDFTISTIVKIIEYCVRDIQQDFYLNNKRFENYYQDFPLTKIIDSDYKLPQSIMNQSAFFNQLSATSDEGFSLITFRNNINKLLVNQPSYLFEERAKKYIENLINSYDSDSRLFSSYKRLLADQDFLKEYLSKEESSDLFLNKGLKEKLKNHIYYHEDGSISFKDKAEVIQYLKSETKFLLNELIIDYLFQDNIYNVYLNIQEILRFQHLLPKGEQPLSKEDEGFYQRILNLDQEDSNSNFSLFNKLKDKNIALLFYTQLRDIKDLSYQKINQSLLQIRDVVNKKDSILSQKYSHPIYDLRNQDYYILVRCLKRPYFSLSENKSESYTLISGENTKTFAINVYDEVDKSYRIYGYDFINKDRILHVLERNSYSRGLENDLEIGTPYVNRILTSEKITNDDENYSEIKIRNEKGNDSESQYKSIYPVYYIVYEDVDEESVSEAKRLNIPVVVISKKLIKDGPKTIPFEDLADMEYGNSKYTPVTDFTFSDDEWGRKKRR